MYHRVIEITSSFAQASVFDNKGMKIVEELLNL